MFYANGCTEIMADEGVWYFYWHYSHPEGCMNHSNCPGIVIYKLEPIEDEE